MLSKIFGGGPKCPVCGKSVYQAEEVVSGGQKFHRQCFQCFNCKKALVIGKQADHKEHVYCQPCYNSLIRSTGYGAATGLTQKEKEVAEKLSVSQGGKQEPKTSVAAVVSARSAPVPPSPSKSSGKPTPTPLKKKFTDIEIQQLRALFAEFDTDRTSSISTAEAKTCLSKFGINLSEAQAQVLIETVDSDHSGEVNFIEFLRMCEVGFVVQQQEEANKKPTEREFVPPPSPPSGTLEVQVGDADLTIDVSKVVITDPWVVVRVVNKEQKTGTAKTAPREGGQTAQWGQDLSFGVPSGTSPSPVSFELWHTNKDGQPEHVGTGSSKLNGEKNSKQTVSVPLLETEDNEQIGVLNVVLLFKPVQESSTVQVHVGDADLSIDVSKVAITNPWVVVQAVSVEQKTGTAKATPKEGGQTAQWGQDLSFDVPSGVSPSSVEFQLWHTNASSQPEQIGTGSSKLDGAKNNKQAVTVPIVETEDNEQIGTLNVVLLYAAGEEKAVVAKEVPKKKNAVFTVWKGKVLEKQDIIGKGDPFVVINVGGKEQRTRTVKDTQEPVWNEVLAFNDISNAEAESPVTITLLDQDTITRNDFIGAANPPLSLTPFTNKPTHIVVPVFDKKGVEQGNVELEVVLEEGAEGGVKEREFGANALAAAEEAARKAAEKAAAEEAARIAAEKAAAEEAARIAAEEEAARVAAEKAAAEEAARIAAEKAAAEEAARIAAEKAAAEEAARIAAEEEAARVAAEKAAAEEAARIAAEKAAAEEAARIAAEEEAARVAAEKAAAEEAARIAAEKAAAEEAARIAAEEEAARVAAEKAAAEEAARIAAEEEAARIAAEKAAAEEAARIAAEREKELLAAASPSGAGTLEVHVEDADLAIDVSKVSLTNPWIVVKAVNAEQKTSTTKAAVKEGGQTAQWGQDFSFEVPSGTTPSSVEFQLWHTGEDGQPEYIVPGSSKLDGEKNTKQAVAVPLIDAEDNEQVGTLNVELLFKVVQETTIVKVHVGETDLAIDPSKCAITNPWVVVRAVDAEQKTGTVTATQSEDKQKAEWGQDLSFDVPSGTLPSSVEFQLWHTGEDGQPEYIGAGSSKLEGSGKQSVAVALIEKEDNEQIGILNVVLEIAKGGS